MLKVRERTGKNLTGKISKIKNKMIPIRCFTCGRVISDIWEEYKERIKHKEPAEVLDELGIKRYCCRRMLLTHAELIDEIAPYE